jgi:hypothetical protein
MRASRGQFVLPLAGILVALVIVEGGLRAYLATRLGASILWYGTAYNRQEIKGMRERERWAAQGDPRALRGPGDEHHTVRFHKDVVDGYSKFFPNQTRYTYDADTGEVIPVRINRHGFRGPDYSPSKEPGVVRIVALGASSTFGYHDRDDETYPYFMERMLQRECGGAARFEVINLGIPHLTSEEIVRLFRNDGLPLRPDYVTFYEGINDSSFDKPKLRSAWRKALARVYRAVREHVVTAAFIEEVMRSDVRTFSVADVERHRAGRSERFLANLSRLLEDCRSIDATLIVANQQARSLLVRREELAGVNYEREGDLVERKLAEQGFLTTKELNFLAHRDLMRDLRVWAASNEVPFVDIIAALDSRRDVLVSWVHLNAEGNRMIAQSFVDAIRVRACEEAAGATQATASF